MVWIFCFRLVMGVGIGGDYPMSASIVSERSHLHTRGRLLAWIFSNQGWVGIHPSSSPLSRLLIQGTLSGSVATIIILSCFKKAIETQGHYSYLDAVWRIQMGIALVPAFATLIPRLRMPEGKKYIESRALNTPASPVSPVSGLLHESSLESAAAAPTTSNIAGTGMAVDRLTTLPTIPGNITDLENLTDPQDRKAKLNAFFVYFKEWRHMKTLIGTASTWFLLDVAFYGTNLNQSVLLADIGYSTGKTEFELLMRNALGNCIIAVSGYVPGYFFTIFLVEKLGRRWIQIQGFLVCALMFAILAGGFSKLSTGGRFACFAIAQVRSPSILTTLRLRLNSCSSFSTSVLTQQHSSSPPKCTLLEFVALRTVSLPPSANSAPFSQPCCSTGFPDPKSSVSPMYFGFFLRVILLVPSSLIL